MAKHEAEVLLGVDSEAPSTGPAAPQAAARGIGPSRRLARGLAAVCTALCAVPALYQAARSFQRTYALEREIPQQLSELHHRTDFGPSLSHLSGLDCYGHNNNMDGVYHFGGTTGEGRAWYVHDPDRFRRNEKTAVLYYDRDCNGAGHWWGMWMLDYGKKEEWDFGRSEAMRYYPQCWGDVETRPDEVAEIDVETGANEAGALWMLDQEPGPAPPTKAQWRVWCGKTAKWQVQNVAVRKTAHIQGQWQFLYSAMPDERVTLKHGKRELTSTNRKWRMQGKDSVEVGGSVEYGLAYISGKASHEVISTLATSWSHEMEYSNEVIREFKLPNDSGSAFYQWVLTASAPDKESLDVLTQSFAFTPDAAHPPRCYPGGSTDGFHYQKCNPGWQLS